MKNPILASIAIAVISALAQPVSAADFPEFLRFSSPGGFSWTGLYVGAHGGYGWTKSQGLDAKGGFGGGQVGFNYQMGSFVLGLEGDGAWADISQGVNGLVFGVPLSVSFQNDALASLRARFGVTAKQSPVLRDRRRWLGPRQDHWHCAWSDGFRGRVAFRMVSRRRRRMGVPPERERQDRVHPLRLRQRNLLRCRELGQN